MRMHSACFKSLSTMHVYMDAIQYPYMCVYVIADVYMCTCIIYVYMHHICVHASYMCTCIIYVHMHHICVHALYIWVYAYCMYGFHGGSYDTRLEYSCGQRLPWSGVMRSRCLEANMRECTEAFSMRLPSAGEDSRERDYDSQPSRNRDQSSSNIIDWK